MNEFLEQFLIESRELVEQASSGLMALEQAPDDRASLDSAFRGFHTLKGAAGIVDFAAMARLVHAAEDMLDSVRSGKRPVTADLISNCLTCLDQVTIWLDAIDADSEVPADADLAADALLIRFGDGKAAVQAASVTAEAPSSWVAPLLARYKGEVHPSIAIRYTPDADCFFRGEDPVALAAALPGLLALGIEPRQPWPAVEDIDPFTCNLVLLAFANISAEQAAEHFRPVAAQVEITAVSAIDVPPSAHFSPLAAAILREQIAVITDVGGDMLDGRMGSVARVAGNVLRNSGLPRQAAEIEASAANADPMALRQRIASVLSGADGEPADVDDPTPAEANKTEPAIRTLRVAVERVDALVKLAGELTILKNALGHSARRFGELDGASELARALKDQHAALDQLTAELQRSVLEIRVLPLGHAFQRFPRLVREMAGTMEKPTRLVTEGEATVADKLVVEALFEPLLHVVRNAMDHGVEPPEQRARSGKPQTATIQLRGRRDGEHVIVEVTDDGRGIDAAAIRRVAFERAMATEEALHGMPDEEVINLIFAPGFSSATAVTDVSGRGVGMDAARATVEGMGGQIRILTEVGKGTTVRFDLPFTVMLTRVITVEVCGQVFGLPFDAIVETLQLPRDRIVPIGSAEAIVLRGRTLPFVRLSALLNLETTERHAPVVNAAVTEVGGQLSALEVDRFGDRLDVMLKPLEGILDGMTGIAGTTVMGDGRVLIVLDLQELLK